MSTRPFQLAMLLAVAGLVVAATTAQPAETPKMIKKVYQVADLVCPVPNDVTVEGPAKPGKTYHTTEDHLVQLIQYSVAPTSWRGNGGQGAIDYYPLGMALIVNQTADVQEQVADLLATLRRDLNVEVALELRFLCVPEGFLKDNRVKLSSKPGSSCAFLNDQEVRKLLETVNADRRTNVMQAPKLTMFNGQMVKMVLPGETCKDGSDGTIRILTQPMVSSDRRFVRLFLNVTEGGHTVKAPASGPVCATKQVGTQTTGSLKFTVGVSSDQGLVGSVVLNERNFDLTLPIAFENTVTLPDGGTMLFGGWKKDVLVPVEQEECPVLSQLPYVSRLFRNVGMKSESSEVYVLVTPRIIIAQDAEERRGTEEQEEPAKVNPEQQRQATVIAGLLKAYDEACAAGHAAEARKYARAALAIDPTCFRR